MPAPSLPASARLPINRCNLPAVILGGLTFQRQPAPLAIDGVRELHADFFGRLDEIPDHAGREALFTVHMAAHFLLDAPEEAGFVEGGSGRVRADYLRVLRGWSFDPDGREGAVLKGWAESRFGLLTRHHRVALDEDDARRRFDQARCESLYNTNALEAQLDLLYAWCQYELARTLPERTHLTLWRGINRLDAHDILETGEGGRRVMLFNNINSFTGNRERADEFGDRIVEAEVPLAKVFFHNRLLPGRLEGEDEYVVIGGVYELRLVA